ncbi:MAG: isopropylmalate synthase [Oscillospiraceae bacterium]|jgi:homocitrate synthase NifV|nr:isopropylmalate synthase [Oscillospiraceae bacterium]
MISITDRTLSCLDAFAPCAAPLTRFLELLIEMGADTIEVSEKTYELLRPVSVGVSLVLRVHSVSDIERHPEIQRFVCRNAPASAGVRTEIVLNDTREAYTIARYADYASVRIQGLDDVMLGDYAAVFKRIRQSFSCDLELCPTNRLNFAGGIAAEWAEQYPDAALVTSFGGIGGFAPTEELAMILRLRRLRKVTKNYEFFPEMAELFRQLTGRQIRRNKPIIGKRIFCVESGIHVDGILKQPKCYEPFPPETVGQTRRIVLGKQSGAASVRLKLSELGVTCDEALIAPILERVKRLSTEKNALLTNAEFEEIVVAVIA